MEPPMKPDERITLETVGSCKTPLGLDHDEKYGVPSLEELGKNKTSHFLLWSLKLLKSME